MGAILAALARIFGGGVSVSGVAGVLSLINRALVTVGITYTAWTLTRVGTVDKVAVATGNVASGVGSVATGVGNVAGATGALNEETLILLAGGIVVLWLVKR
jgi:hypothetical protein